MLSYGRNGDSLGLVDLENPLEEVVERGFLLLVLEELLCFDVVGESETALALGVDVVEHVDAFEGKLSEQQVEKQHSKRPNVHFLPVRHGFKDFRRHVVLGAAVGVGLHFQEAGESEIADLAG